MRSMLFCLSILVIITTLPACQQDGHDTTIGLTAMGLVEGTPEAVGLLKRLNHETTTTAVLVEGAGLDPAAAEALTDHRLGADGVFGTDDDGVFETLLDIEEVWALTPSDIDRLQAWLADTGWIPRETDTLGTWLGIEFSAATAWATLELTNHATPQFLATDVGLEQPVIDTLLAARPLMSVAHLASLDVIDHHRLQRLKETACAVVN